MELYYYEDCEYSQAVLNTVTNLKIKDQLTLKDIRKHPEYEQELFALTGSKTVPCLVTEDSPLKETKTIRKYLVSRFM